MCCQASGGLVFSVENCPPLRFRSYFNGEACLSVRSPGTARRNLVTGNPATVEVPSFIPRLASVNVIVLCGPRSVGLINRTTRGIVLYPGGQLKMNPAATSLHEDLVGIGLCPMGIFRAPRASMRRKAESNSGADVTQRGESQSKEKCRGAVGRRCRSENLLFPDGWISPAALRQRLKMCCPLRLYLCEFF